LDFSVDVILQLHYDLGVDSAYNSNEYQEYSWERPARKADNLTANYEAIV
jgi:hypothetical protein